MTDDQPPSSYRNFFQNIGNLFQRQNASKEAIREYLQDAQDNDVIDSEEATMMLGVLAVYDQRVRDVMLPKSKMVTVFEDMSYEDTIALVLESGHSRFPVARDEEIIGLLLAKDLLKYVGNNQKDYRLRDILRPVRHIPESQPLNILLHQFRLERTHMVIVTNEYGDVSGLVTIEDVLEEIVGDIDDEHDSEEENGIKKLDDEHYLVPALTEIYDFNEYFATDLDTENSDTIGGFVLSRFGYVPQVGEQVWFDGLLFVIKKANDRRIIELLVSKQEQTNHSDNG